MRRHNIPEIIVRGIILHRGRVLMCRLKDANWYFFPGGHVEFGEGAEEALRRELKEELGAVVRRARFIGAVENVFSARRTRHHELNIVFAATADHVHGNAREGHITFEWQELRAFPRVRVLPLQLKRALIRWLKDRKLFWVPLR